MKKFLFSAAISTVFAFSAASAEIFHFNFSEASGKQQYPAARGSFRCVADNGTTLIVQNGALRIAPAANIYIEGNFPELKRELTISLWFLRRGKAWDNPLLMRGYHNGKIDFLLQCRWIFPSFSYKDPANPGHWEGLYVTGPIPRDMSYGRKEWRLTADHARPDQWNLLQVTFKDGETKIYLNGILNCRNVSSCKTLTSSSPRLYIGSERLSPHSKLGYLTGDMLINDIHLFDRALEAGELEELRRREQAKYSSGKIMLADCNAYPPAPGYDPEFKRKLKLTAEYEKKILPDLSGAVRKGGADAKIHMHNGAPVLEIGGRLYFPLQLSPASKRGMEKLTCNIRDFAAAGVDLVNLAVNPEKCWKGAGKYDFSAIDASMQATVAGNPEARVMVWALLRPPSWFNQAYPDEIEKSVIGSRISNNIGGGPLGSDVWERHASEYLAALVRHVEASPYADRVFGYLPGGGESGEWYWPGGVYGMVVGFSKATAKSFREWLRQKYRNDVSLLRKAWNRNGIDFDNARVPSPELRDKLDEPDFFIDRKLRHDIYDFRRYMCTRTIDAIRRAAKTIKQNCNGRKLVFLYNGYSFSATPKKLYNSGLLITEQVLNTPEIDVIVTPITYNERRGGQYGGCVNPWAASAILHGKMPWQEDDLRTHFCFTATDGRSESAAETAEIFKRDTGLALTKNLGNWWLLFEPDWCHDELTMNTVARSRKAVNEALNHNRKTVAQVAFIWDEESLLELNRVKGSFISDHAQQAYRGSFQMGAPADFYLSGDLSHPQMPDYRLYIFLNCYRTDKTLRKNIEAKVKRNNAVAVWCYAPGYITETGRNVNAMKTLTGIELRELPGKHQAKLKITDRNHPITRYASNAGTTYLAAPAFAVNDPGARILGEVNGMPALTVKEHSDWRSVYSLMPLSKELLTGLCDYAGVHVYARDFDILSVNAGYLMLHAVSTGRTRITLPGHYDVTEIYSGMRHAENARSFSCRMDAGTTKIFKLEKK